MKYIITPRRLITRSMLDSTGYGDLSEVAPICDLFGNQTDCFVIKITDEFNDLFVKFVKFDKTTAKEKLLRAQDGTLEESEIIYS